MTPICEPKRITETEPGTGTHWHQLRCSVHGWIETYPGDLEDLRPKMLKRFELHVREQKKNEAKEGQVSQGATP